MTEATYTVTGMTCEHCVKAVTEEVGRITGVSGVSVELSTGVVRVISAGPIKDDDVRAAVDEAGYELAEN